LTNIEAANIEATANTITTRKTSLAAPRGKVCDEKAETAISPNYRYRGVDREIPDGANDDPTGVRLRSSLANVSSKLIV
jgi:hypothetical protein